jgi:VPS28 protein
MHSNSTCVQRISCTLTYKSSLLALPDSRRAKTGRAEERWFHGESITLRAQDLLLMKGRLITLNGMKASEELTEEQSRQFFFDVDHAYAEFFRSLGGGKDEPS